MCVFGNKKWEFFSRSFPTNIIKVISCHTQPNILPPSVNIWMWLLLNLLLFILPISKQKTIISYLDNRKKELFWFFCFHFTLLPRSSVILNKGKWKENTTTVTVKNFTTKFGCLWRKLWLWITTNKKYKTNNIKYNCWALFVSYFIKKKQIQFSIFLQVFRIMKYIMENNFPFKLKANKFSNCSFSIS